MNQKGYSDRENVTRLNDRAFLLEVLESCRERDLCVWLFGGWAEELWGLTTPRIHTDIDLLYPANDFSPLDAAIHEASDWQEILLKRFPHKRAILIQGIMVEFFLVRGKADRVFSDFFGKFRFDWPPDTFDYTAWLSGMTVNVASQTALAKYRNENHYVRRAYEEYIAEQDAAADFSQDVIKKEMGE